MDELNAVFEAIQARAAKAFGMDLFTIALCGPDPGQVIHELTVEQGVRQPRQTRQLGDGLSDLVLSAKRPLMVRSFELEEGSLPLSWMGAPLVVGDTVLGLIVVQSLRQGAFDERDLSILSVLAGWAATAVDCAQQLQRQRAEAGTCGVLLRASKSLVREKEEAGVLKAVAEAVSSLVECHLCSVWSWSAERREFRSQWRAMGSDGSAEEFAASHSHPARAVAVEEMLTRRDVVVVSEEDGWRLGEYGGLRPSEPRVVALVPLVAEGEVLGQVVVEGNGVGDFPAHQVALLREMADMAALAIHRSRRNGYADQAMALRELTKVESGLIPAISHELRTPLGLVLTGTELLMDRLTEPEKLRQVAGLVNQGTLRLAGVVDDLIEFAELQVGSVSSYLADADPVAVVRGAIDEAADPVHSRRVVLETVGALPSVKVDSLKLKSVAVKLVRNAVNFSPEPTRVLVRVSMEPTRLKVEVGDGGFGIPPEEIPRVFEPFFRGRISQDRHVSGLGLGLSIVRRLVEAMGGEIDLRSELEKGTVVTVAIPVGGARPAPRLNSDEVSVLNP